MSHRIWFILCLLVAAASIPSAGLALATGHDLVALANTVTFAFMVKAAHQIGWTNT